MENKVKYGLNTFIIEQFVTKACEGRDSSHGLQHAQKVKVRALEINRTLPEPVTAFDVSLVALLHDVPDHKYDTDGTLIDKVREFLISYSFNPFPIIQCINAISFSKEKKMGLRWFESVLDPYWIKVRDIVSDADKLEALGVEGGQRCLEYGASRGDPGVKHLLQHLLDKLLILKRDYIVTDYAKKQADKLEYELLVFALDLAIKEL